MVCITFIYFINRPWIVILLWYTIQKNHSYLDITALRETNHFPFLGFILYLLLLFLRIQKRKDWTKIIQKGNLLTPFISLVAFEFMRRWGTLPKRAEKLISLAPHPYSCSWNPCKWTPSSWAWEVPTRSSGTNLQGQDQSLIRNKTIYKSFPYVSTYTRKLHRNKTRFQKSYHTTSQPHLFCWEH